MFEVPHIQGSREWLAWRSMGITATEAGIIMGANPYTTPWGLWAERVGKIAGANLDKNPNVIRGKTYEDMARNAYNDQYGCMLIPTCGEYSANRIIRASFDGIDGNGVPGEIKVPADKTFEDVATNLENSESYKMHWHQVQHQMLVADAEIGRLFFFNPTTKQGIPFEIKRDEEHLKRLIDKEMEMWDFIQSRKAPPLDTKRDLFQPDVENEGVWLTFASQWQSVQQELADLEAKTKPLEALQKSIEGKMKSMMGEFLNAQYGGIKITRYWQDGSIDYQEAIKALRPATTPQEVEPYRRKGGMRMRVGTYEVTADLDQNAAIHTEIVCDDMAIDY